MELYSKDVVSGGTGIYYSASNIFIIGRQQEKEGTDVIGYNFIINVEKSRCVREKSKIPVEVTFEDGISTWSGLLDVALESGHVVKPSNGWYSKKDESTKYRLADTYTHNFWSSILKDPEFQEFVKRKYLLAHGALVADLTDDEIESEYLNV
jgi:hypothetical protein